ncbi:NUDIX domain-containing protein [Microbacteriaceae bacterium VKM Ac-2855]|nr:NUDIX domain-containing protein [Microbacteriaceae bacterium VKM Ac-2855]
MPDSHRRVSRILLVDERDRILLMLTDFPRLREPVIRWITPGGGVDDGESYREGALRELWEETGLRIEDPGEPVWALDSTAVLADGSTQFSHSEFYLVRTAHFDPVDEHWMADEFVDIREVRWWSLDELASTADDVAPVGLSQRLQELLGRPVT